MRRKLSGKEKLAGSALAIAAAGALGYLASNNKETGVPVPEASTSSSSDKVPGTKTPEVTVPTTRHEVVLSADEVAFTIQTAFAPNIQDLQSRYPDNLRPSSNGRGTRVVLGQAREDGKELSFSTESPSGDPSAITEVGFSQYDYATAQGFELSFVKQRDSDTHWNLTCTEQTTNSRGGNIIEVEGGQVYINAQPAPEADAGLVLSRAVAVGEEVLGKTFANIDNADITTNPPLYDLPENGLCTSLLK